MEVLSCRERKQIPQDGRRGRIRTLITHSKHGGGDGGTPGPSGLAASARHRPDRVRRAFCSRALPEVRTRI